MGIVAYYRVSTKRQGQSGLGLDAQRSSVLSFAKITPIIKEFKDIESGKNDNRPELMKAIQYAKDNKAKLVIAKLDRLSRNLTFISQLIDTKVSFTCADMPDANEFTIHIFAALAQQERKMISERTKAALDERKKDIGEWRRSGQVFLNNPDTLQRAIQTNKTKALDNERNKRATAMIKMLRAGKKSYQDIAKTLNDNGFRTSTGKEFQATQVMRLYQR